MEKTEFRIPYRDGSLHCISWEPDGEPLATLQIVHGMIEYADRYDQTAEYFAARGFAVVAHDHPGHGSTAESDDDLGYIPRDGGSELMAECVHLVTEYIADKYPGVPHFILGHSMGSFITRRYLTKYGKEVDGAIIVGTGNQKRSTLAAARAVTSIVSKFKGERYRSPLITRLAFGSYNKRCGDDESRDAWICSDKELMKVHDADKYATFMFTAAGYGVLFDTLTFLARKTDFENIPKELPILVMAGTEDPVGAYGREPSAFAKQCTDAGIADVVLKLYEGDRHEILNETDKEKVWEDLFVWLKAHMSASV